MPLYATRYGTQETTLYLNPPIIIMRHTHLTKKNNNTEFVCINKKQYLCADVVCDGGRKPKMVSNKGSFSVGEV